MALLWALGGALPVAAAPRLIVQELKLPERPVLLFQSRWQGRAAVWALGLRDGPPGRGSPSPLPLYLLRFEAAGPRIESAWELPKETRWVEPVTLPGGVQRLLGLIGGRWYLGRLEGGRPEGARWEWAPLCECDSIFAEGKEVLPQGLRFAVDLDRDGTDGFLLPGWHGLTAYRFGPAGAPLVPRWRVHWEIQQKYEMREGVRVAAELPRYLLLDANGDGVLDFVELGEAGLRVAYLPSPQPAPPLGYLFLDGEKRTRLRNQGLPEPLAAALEKLGTRAFAEEAELAQALAAAPGAAAEAAWRPHWAALLALAREPIPVLAPVAIPLPGLGPKKKGESYSLLSVGDMDGNGTLDALHAKSIDESDAFNQKNQLRWYSGRLAGGRLSFGENPQLFFTEGPAFAELVRPRTAAAERPALFVATMEVSLMAVIRAITVKSVSIDAFLYQWDSDRIVVPAVAQASLSFGVDIGSQKRPMLVLADLAGNGQREFVFNLRPDQFVAFPADGGIPRWSGAPVASAQVELPRKRDWITVADLDGDGREELLLWYRGGSDPPELKRTLRVIRQVDAPPPP
ncbi:MAG: hypothetical protein HY423_06050 [Candidatus Lambdaproteobacteria bacterium]|nr:hypothetical protein [Candidatus Lambdaproteobacteria bacterium]